MNFRFFKTLRFKFIASGLVFQIALSLFLLQVVISETDSNLTQHLKSEIVDVEGLLAASLVEPYLQRDYAAMRQLMQMAISPDKILAIRVYDIEWQEVVTMGATLKLTTAALTNESMDVKWNDAPDAIQRSLPLKVKNQEIGAVQFSVSLALQKLARGRMIDNFLKVAIPATLVAVLAFVALGYGLTRRIKTLSEASRGLLIGKFPEMIEDKSHDEIGQLSRAFDKMCKSVQVRIHALSESEKVKSELLHESASAQTRLNAVLNSMGLGIVFLDNDGRVIFSNPALKKIWRNIEPDFSSGGVVDIFESTLPDGRVISRRWESVTEEGGQIIGVLWIFEDITAERMSH